MRKRIGWLALLVVAGGMLTPAKARAQESNMGYEVPPPPGVTTVPWPFGSTRPEDGGLYVAGQFIFWRMSNPMRDQIIAVHGFIDRDGSITNALGITPSFPGVFVGDKSIALSTEQVTGPGTFEPGFIFTIGYRFRNGVAVEGSWTHLQDTRNSASATLALNPFQSPGTFQENTFLFAPVFNYTTVWFGPGNKKGNGNVGADSGIWNGANVMTEDFVQRFDMADITIRYPLCENENCGWRMYGLCGFRMVWFWERFRWETDAADVNGLTAPDDIANYTNVVSNRMYGLHIGLGNEWELCDTPLGAVAFSMDLGGALFADFVKARAKYELGDLSASAQRNRNFFELVPELQAKLSLWWYPYQSVQARLSYDVLAFFNTVAAPNPVDFNMGAMAPPWEDGVFRFIHGLSIGVAWSF
jgi:hypothetical protein